MITKKTMFLTISISSAVLLIIVYIMSNYILEIKYEQIYAANEEIIDLASDAYGRSIDYDEYNGYHYSDEDQDLIDEANQVLKSYNGMDNVLSKVRDFLLIISLWCLALFNYERVNRKNEISK